MEAIITERAARRIMASNEAVLPKTRKYGSVTKLFLDSVKRYGDKITATVGAVVVEGRATTKHEFVGMDLMLTVEDQRN